MIIIKVINIFMYRHIIRNKAILIGLFLLVFVFGIKASQAAPSLASRLKGYILLQVESHGEAWYVIPTEQKKVYMKDGSVAYQIMREVSLGITNANLVKIPVGIEARFNDQDTDQDGLADRLEEGLDTNPNNPDTDNDGFKDGDEIKSGYNPLNKNKLVYDTALVNRLKGYILLQTEKQGQAWYLNPKDGKRYYMRDGEAAYKIMRYLSLGITNTNLNLIPNSTRTFKTIGNGNGSGNNNGNSNNGNNNSTSTPPNNNNSGGGGGGGGGGSTPSSDRQAPTAPNSLVAVASGTSISLSWTASTDNVGVVGYQILRSTTNGSGYSQITTSNTNSYTNNGLNVGTTYYYVIKAYDAAGNVSLASAQAQATAADNQAPSVPGGLSATASGSQISLAWTASTDNVGVKQYLIERSNTSNSFGFVPLATSTTSVYVNTHLAVNTTFYYRVRAQDAAGNISDYSLVVSATTNTSIVVSDNQAPTMPSGLTATASGTSISLAWTASTDNIGVVGYQVLRSTTNGSGYSQIATANTNSYTNNGLNVGTTYYYVVKAYDAAANVSATSTQAQATVPVPADTQRPTAPTGLTATAAHREAALSWTASTDNVGVVGYQIWRSTTNGSGYVQQTTVNTTVYVDTNLTNGTTYYYIVKAYDAAGNVSFDSSQAQATPYDNLSPTAPTTLIANVSGTQVTLTWTASTDNVGVTQYLIERSVSNSNDFSSLLTVSTNSHIDSGLTNNTTYYYRVRAQDAAGNNSSYSNVSSVTVGTVATTNPSISSVSGTLSSGQTVTISGSNFGSKSQANPLIWDNFEDGINNATIRNTNPVIGPAWNVWTNGTDPVYTSTNNRANSARSALFDFSGSTGYTKFLQYYTTADSAYFTFWWRYNKTSNQWSANIKPWDEFGTGTSGICPSIYSGFGSPLVGDGYLRASVTDCGGGTGQQLNSNMFDWLSYDSPIDEIQGQWVRMEMYVKQSSAPNVADGIYKMWVHKPDGEGITLDISSNNVITRNTMDEWYQWWLLGAYHTMDDRSPLATGQVFGDDVYFDTTQARVELGNAATWSANTRREIQIPSTWSNGSLSFTANAGVFTAGQTAYLYVVDANGNVNANGYPVTISGTTTDQTAPTVPTNLSASASGTQISLTWTASTDNVGVSQYLIERSTSASSGFTQVATSNTTSYINTGLANSTTYYYRVRAQDAAGNISSSYASANATTGALVVDTQAPTTPTNLSASVTGSNVSLTWTASTDAVGVSGYQIWRSTTNGGPYNTFIANSNTTSYTHTNVPIGTYYYIVKAYDASFNYSGNSNQATVLISSNPVSTTNLLANSWDFSSAAWDGDILEWSPKSNFIFTSGQSDPFGTNKAFSVALANSSRGWQQRDTTPDLVLNYDTVTASIYVKYGSAPNIIFGITQTDVASSVGEFEQTFTFSGGVPVWSSGNTHPQDGHTVTSVGNGWYRLTLTYNLNSRGIKGHPFSFRVTPAGSSSTAGAYTYIAGAQLESGSSATAYVETPNGVSDGQAPSTPTNLSASVSGSNATLSWTASTDAVGVSGYQIWRSTTSGSGYTQQATVSTNLYTQSSLSAGTYYYIVKAYDAAGNVSGNSNQVTVNIASQADDSAPTAPSNLSSSVSGNNVSLSWNSSTDNVGVTQYLVERSSNGGSSYSQVGTTSNTSYSMSLADYTTYSCRVRAQDAAGNMSLYSNVTTFTTGAASSSGSVSITSVNDNTISNGQSITISGSGFGTKIAVGGIVGPPVLWDNFEDGANGQLLQPTTAKWDRIRSDNTSGPRYYQGAIDGSMGVRTGSGIVDGVTGGTTRTMIEDDEYRHLYLDYYIKAVRGEGLLQRSSKQVMIWSANAGISEDGPNTAFWQITQGGDEPPFAFSEYSCGNEPVSITYNNGWGVNEFLTPRHVQIEYRRPTNIVGSPDYHGTLRIWYDGILVTNRSTFGSYSCDPDRNYLDNLYIGHYQDVDSAIEPIYKWISCPGDSRCDQCPAGASGCSVVNDNWLPARQDEFFYDNIYIDKSIARIEIGNASTYGASTRREIQVPTSWGSTIQFTANKGGFSSGQTVYLYVIDSNGNVNSSGYPVTFN